MSDPFLQDVLAGLSRSPKSIPSKYFYDAEGSRLFEAITRLPEYYPTRTETALLTQIAPEVAGRIPPGGALVEFGSGASVKTRLLLDAAPHLARYVPIDISPAALEQAAETIRLAYPRLSVEPIIADFTAALALPSPVLSSPRLGFFPGSTIGNFGPADATAFLARAKQALGAGAGLLVGIDLVKASETLVAAYDDPSGVTAAFNKNLLARTNRELGGDFDLATFDHRAVWNAIESRIEMHLVSRSDQVVRIADRSFDFKSGETIHTENSYKFTVEGFSTLATNAGWRIGPVWSAPEPTFALVLLEA